MDADARPVQDATDAAARLAAAVDRANIPTLLPVLVQMTGDLRWLDERYRPSRSRGLDDNDDGGLPPDVQAEVRDAAATALRDWVNGRPLAVPEPPSDLLIHMLSVAVGEEVPAEYGPMIAHELQVGQCTPATPPPLRTPHEFKVVIIGAGVSGIAAAVRCDQAGIAYEIIERERAVGGTWLTNRYPGAGVDTPSHVYSFPFAPHDWPHYFASRDELQDYIEAVVDDFGIRSRIIFGYEVAAITYDDDGHTWTIRATSGFGETVERKANVVISAVGAFNKPKWPDIPGLGDFAGTVVHTAQWPDHGVDLDQQRVAVIGNGASAMQVVPAIAGVVAELAVFQRSPQWAAPFAKFHMPVPSEIRYLLQHVPLYRAWYRMRLSWVFNDRVYDALRKDPDWPHGDRSVNSINDGHRRFFTRYIQSEIGDRTDLLADLLPTYPPYGKRILLDNGWFRTMTRENVRLDSTPIQRILADRVVTASGGEYQVDIIILATGFDVVNFIAPMEVYGRGGRRLADVWQGDDARAYLGLAVPGFPNFFCLYGPNAQFGHGGSWITVLERQIRYIQDLLDQLFIAGGKAVEIRSDVHDAYNSKVDELHEGMIWTHPGMDTYYRNSRGRVVVNNPFRVIDFWLMTEKANLAQYLVDGLSLESVASTES